MGPLEILVAVGLVCTVFATTPPSALDGLNARKFYAGDEAMTDHLIFEVSLPEFMQHWQAQDPRDLYWTSDACSQSPDHPFGYDCMRSFASSVFRINSL